MRTEPSRDRQGRRGGVVGAVDDAQQPRFILSSREVARVERTDGAAAHVLDLGIERVVEDAVVQKEFRMCQAMWASNYDNKGARVPDTDDSYVLIPTE